MNGGRECREWQLELEALWGLVCKPSTLETCWNLWIWFLWGILVIWILNQSFFFVARQNFQERDWVSLSWVLRQWESNVNFQIIQDNGKTKGCLLKTDFGHCWTPPTQLNEHGEVQLCQRGSFTPLFDLFGAWRYSSAYWRRNVDTTNPSRKPLT